MGVFDGFALVVLTFVGPKRYGQNPAVGSGDL